MEEEGEGLMEETVVSGLGGEGQVTEAKAGC